MISNSRIVFASTLSFAFVLGCGGGSNVPARVSGKVTYNGSPVPAGVLAFHTKDAGTYTCGIQDGSYSASDLPAGEIVVTITTELYNPSHKTPEYRSMGGAPGAGAMAAYGGKAPGAGAGPSYK